MKLNWGHEKWAQEGAKVCVAACARLPVAPAAYMWGARGPANGRAGSQGELARYKLRLALAMRAHVPKQWKEMVAQLKFNADNQLVCVRVRRAYALFSSLPKLIFAAVRHFCSCARPLEFLCIFAHQDPGPCGV